jgi:pimeloyl-ACP methyl ester carboxylesterase
MAGASEGGIITALLVEQYPDRLDGGLGVCGPIGDFPYQIDYFGNARVLFEYFFPGLIPGDMFDPPPELGEDWPAFYDEFIATVITRWRTR